VGLTVRAKEMLQEVHRRHSMEYGKVAQKLLAMTFERIGFKLNQERAVQGVDIDVIDLETGKRMSMEVKTSQDGWFSIGEKDVEGLQARKNDHYDTFYAVLSMPHCLGEGWVVVPADGIGKGRHSLVRLAGRKLPELCERINSAFPGVLEEVCPDLMRCSRGSALGMLKARHGI